jgi:hypothetical protein
VRRSARLTIIAAATLIVAAAAAAQDRGGWHPLEVPGGRTTLRALGVSDAQPRSTVMVELVRRLHFSTTPQTDLETALRHLPVSARDVVTLPSPLPAPVWSHVLSEKSILPARLFEAILNDTSARLLFHGLAAMDGQTRRWFERQPDLLRRLHRNPDAIKSFALFAPSVRVASDRVEVPGAATGEQRWSGVLGANPDQPARFIQRLFEDRKGRSAGLYATIAFAEPPRQRFLLTRTPARFARLVDGFAHCYPADANDYPFALRSNDPAYLLMEIGVDDAGAVAGPRSVRFWERVLDADDLAPPTGIDLAGGDAIDAAWVVERLCAAPATSRAGVFATILAGHRTFAGLPVQHLPDAAIALRVRRLFPAVFVAMEGAGIRDAATFGIVGRHALQFDRLNDLVESPITLRQFQGTLALILSVTASGTWSPPAAASLLASLASVPLKAGRYDGALSAWLQKELLPSISRALPSLRRDASAEEVVAAGLAGSPPASVRRIHWEGHDYVVDFSAAAKERLLAVRARQGGVTLDRAIASRNDGQLAQALASWAYAPDLGAANGGALVGGDASIAHDFGVRSVNRTRFLQRWELPATASDRPPISGSLLGLEAALANWSLRRLSSDRIPSPPTISSNDLKSLYLTVALSDPAALDDDGLMHLASSIARGTQRLDQARADPTALIAAGRRASISPWRREVLPWLIAEEPDRLDEQFSLLARARIGGLRERDVAAWGTSALATGCLCLRMPAPWIPELVLGRPADGIVGAQSADLMLRIAMILSEMQLPASLASPVLSYAMRDFLDAVRPAHPADFDAYSRAALVLGRTTVEDYIGAIAAVGALRPVAP